MLLLSFRTTFLGLSKMVGRELGEAVATKLPRGSNHSRDTHAFGEMPIARAALDELACPGRQALHTSRPTGGDAEFEPLDGAPR